MSLIHRVLQYLLGLVARRVCAQPLIFLIIGVIFAALSTWVVVTRFNIVNNTTDLLSDKYESKQKYNELRKDFGSDSRFIVLIKSPDIMKNREAADAIGQYLESDALKPHVGTVLYKIDFSTVKPRLLFTRDTPELQKIYKEVQGEVDDQEATNEHAQQISLDLNSILNEANQKFNDSYLRKKENWKDFKPFVARFVSILNKVSSQAEGHTGPAAKKATSPDDATSLDEFNSDDELAQHEYFSLQGGQALLVFAYTGEEEKDSQAPFTETVGKIRAYLKSLEPKYPGMELKLTGEPVLEADQIATSTSDSIKAVCITLVLIIGLFICSYRAIVRPALTFGILIMAVLWSLGFALVFVGHFNVMSIAVIPMVLGIGIDFGIQILGRYEEELGHNRTVEQSITAALQHTGVAIITGGSTTAAAFFTLCFNDFVGLSELGIIAGASMALCIVANLVMLPAAFILSDRKRSPEQLRAQSSDSAWHFIHSWDRDIVRTPRFWLWVSAAISVAAAVSLPFLRFDYNLLHLQNQSASSVQNLYAVMNASKNDNGDQISTIYSSVVANNVDEARELNKKLSALPVVARVDSVLDLVPENQDQKLPIIKKIVKAAGELNVKPSTNKTVDIPRAQKDISSLLQQSREGLKQAKGYTGISSVARDAVTAFSTMIPALERADKALHSAKVSVLQQRFSASSNGAFTSMQKNIELLKSQKADRGLTLDDIPPQLKRLFVSHDGKKMLLQVYGKKDLWERGPDEEFVNGILPAAPNATGTAVLNYYATDLLRVSYLWAAVWAFLAIVVLIFLHFQSVKYLFLTLTPLVLAVLWRTGAMVWFGIEFNPANIVTLPLIIGIDVAFGIYIIDRYREDGRLSIFSGSTGKAIIMSSLTSLFGFVSLLVSQFTGMFSIGQLMSLGIAIGLVTSIFVLPQILVLLKPEVPSDK